MSHLDFYLAQINVSRMIAPLSDPLMRGFAEQLHTINALADSALGFVWRLQGTHGDATDLRSPLGDDILVNVSVWESLESLKAYAYKTAHVTAMRDRRNWFTRMDEEHLALWWVSAGQLPTLEEAIERLQILREQGETERAFTFRKSFSAPEPETKIEIGYVPGILGKISELFALHFAKSHGFGLAFEAKVAVEMAEFLGRYDENRDLQLSLHKGREILGGLSVDGQNAETNGARLRWFILSENAGEGGWGSKLLQKAIEHCCHQGYPSLFLTTVSGLAASRHLYEKHGFTLISEVEDRTWGTLSTEQCWRLNL